MLVTLLGLLRLLPFVVVLIPVKSNPEVFVVIGCVLVFVDTALGSGTT